MESKDMQKQNYFLQSWAKASENFFKASTWYLKTVGIELVPFTCFLIMAKFMS